MNAVFDRQVQGTVQVDGYADHSLLGRHERLGGALTLAACWVYARCGLETVFDSIGSPVARAGQERLAQLAQNRGQDPARRGGDAPVRPMDRVRAVGERFRRMARRTALAPRQEADLLHRHPVGRAAGLPPWLPRRDVGLRVEV